MKILAAAFLFLIVAAALVSPTEASLRIGSSNSRMHRPRECCSSYTQENIQCQLMKDYFLKTSGCPLPAIIFKSKRGQKICANPKSMPVQHCMEEMDEIKKRKKVLLQVNVH